MQFIAVFVYTEDKVSILFCVIFQYLGKFLNPVIRIVIPLKVPILPLDK